MYLQRDIPFLNSLIRKYCKCMWKSTEDYCEVVERLADEPVDLLEINISCPNVKKAELPLDRIQKR